MISNKKITWVVITLLLVALIATCVSPSPYTTHLTILHTNDTHSQLFPLDSSKGKEAGLGGVAERMTLINEIRRENPNTLLFDAGDFCQGTPYFNFYKGAIEVELINKMGYDALTLGNHEFDNGVQSLSDILSKAKFAVISSNYDFTDSPMQGKTLPYKIFQIQGVKIGVMGLTLDKTGLVSEENSKSAIYLDPISSSQATADTLINKGCSVVVALSHLGYKGNDERIGDKELASQTSGIDVIIGGHTHTALQNGDVVKNLKGQDVLITQTGGKGMQLGRIDLTLSIKD